MSHQWAGLYIFECDMDQKPQNSSLDRVVSLSKEHRPLRAVRNIVSCVCMRLYHCGCSGSPQSSKLVLYWKLISTGRGCTREWEWEWDCLCLAQWSEHRLFLRNPKVYAQRLGGRAVGQTEPTLLLNPVHLNCERQANNTENKHGKRLLSQWCSLSPKSPLYDALDFSA